MFVADLHIHSRFSRATSRSLDFPQLDAWAGRKGLTVVGSGDITHPGWLAEAMDRLEEAESGLYRLKPEYHLPGGGGVRFILSTEISSIYKQGGRVRKVHSLILLPNLETAQKLSRRLDVLGNIRSDGRPILGLSAKDLLALSLDVDPRIFFIPAHVWTPWFSLLGSNSGFDRVEECFEDLTPHIHALETGLSSDPPMNWRLSALDRFVLVSNSDAHSPEKLGREANLFHGEPSYDGMIEALTGRKEFGGTLEFFPEEGKYHLDGHRKCDRRMTPEETVEHRGLCPVCGRPATVGVSSRVHQLADRPEGHQPSSARPYYRLIPLVEVLSEIIGVGGASRKVMDAYYGLLKALGPELYILREAPLSDIAQAGGGLLAQAVDRMRSGRIWADAGYDGEYGVIRVFGPGEIEQGRGQESLFAIEAAAAPVLRKARKKRAAPPSPAPVETILDLDPEPHDTVVPEPESGPFSLLHHSDPLLDDLNPAQRRAVTLGPGPAQVVAGPGTGKTTVLTRRAAWLVREGWARAENILAVTFTRRAAAEMASRLAGSLPFRGDLKKVMVTTFHGLGLAVLADMNGGPPRVLDEDQRLELARRAAKDSPFSAQDLVQKISLAKQKILEPDQIEDPDLAGPFNRYEAARRAFGAMDFDDLVVEPVRALDTDPYLAQKWRDRFSCVLVDEYQDINDAQYQLLERLLNPESPNLFVIGDPDQAIYGFRGANAGFFQRFAKDFPLAARVRLNDNYRSSEAILKASGQVIRNNRGPDRSPLKAHRKGPARVTLAELASPAAEAEYVVLQIEKLLGGTGHFSLDSGRVASGEGTDLGLGDIAILYRLHALAGPLVEALTRAGLPFQRAGEEPIRETDGLDPAADKIALLSMHAAKGLEFEVVFVVGLEKGLAPYTPPGRKKSADPAEERRLFFVAMTRAKRRLFLTRSRARSLFGKNTRPAPSPFLEEIEASLKLNDQLPDRPAKPAATRQMTLF